MTTSSHYLRLAEEIDHHDPVIAYWLKRYAMEVKGASEEKAKLGTVIDELSHTVFQCGLEIFNAACNKDGADDYNGTARLFFHTWLLWDVAFHFNLVEVDKNLKELHKYAKWRATEINRAMKEGRSPAPQSGQPLSPRTD